MIFSRAAVSALTSRASRRVVAARIPTAFGNTQQYWMSSVAVPDAPTSNHAYNKVDGADGTIIYTETDEAPALATYSLYPAVAKVGRFLCPMSISSPPFVATLNLAIFVLVLLIV